MCSPLYSGERFLERRCLVRDYFSLPSSMWTYDWFLNQQIVNSIYVGNLQGWHIKISSYTYFESLGNTFQGNPGKYTWKTAAPPESKWLSRASLPKSRNIHIGLLDQSTIYFSILKHLKFTSLFITTAHIKITNWQFTTGQWAHS